MKKREVRLGMQVTTAVRVEAFYGGFDGWRTARPRRFFKPGMLGIVAVIAEPAVQGPLANYCCVDFTGEDGIKWRCSLKYSQVRRSSLHPLDRDV